MSDGATTEGLVAQMHALTARLDAQQAEIAALRAPRSEGRLPTRGAPRSRQWGRRGLLAGSAALAAGALARLASPRTAEANDPNDIQRNGTTATEAGAALFTASTTTLLPYTFWGDNETSFGSVSFPDARVGLLGSTAGVDSTTKQRIGVYGATDGAISNVGVYGSSPNNGIGVRGLSGSGYGVYGTSSTFGVVGDGLNGVYGNGVGSGSYGLALGSNSSGVYGYSDGLAAIYGQPKTLSTYAGIFNGNVYITGTLNLRGSPLSAVRGRDGSLRATHALGAAEPLLEDVGRARVTNGVATVALDPDFVGLIASDDYTVFVTPEGLCEGLAVTARTPSGFEVRELRGGTGTLRVRVPGRGEAPRREWGRPAGAGG